MASEEVTTASRAPLSFPPTILMLDLPPKTFVGVDLISFDSSPKFHGVTSVPPGWHFLYTGGSASLSLRHGLWLSVPDQQDDFLLALRWDSEGEELTRLDDDGVVQAWRARLQNREKEAVEGLFPYRQTVSTSDGTPVPEESDFPALTRHVTPHLLGRLTGTADSRGWTLTSSSCAPEDRDDIPGLSTKEAVEGRFGGEEKELVFLGIDLARTWPEGAIGRDRTEKARDRSWALERVVEGVAEAEVEGRQKTWGQEVLGEVEVCFIAVLTLSNWSFLEEWKRVLGLVLSVKEIIGRQEGFFVALLRVLRLQLKHCDDADGGLFDIQDAGAAFLKKLLRGFKRTLEEEYRPDQVKAVREEFSQLESWLKDHWDVDVDETVMRSGIVELDDGEAVELEADNDQDFEDETGEYAPVVVDLQ